METIDDAKILTIDGQLAAFRAFKQGQVVAEEFEEDQGCSRMLRVRERCSQEMLVDDGREGRVKTLRVIEMPPHSEAVF